MIKSYQVVIKLDPYPDITIEKQECIGHVQKRVGAGLRSYKQIYKGKKLKDNKLLSGAGRLTNKVKNTLQNYYGMVVRSNIGDLYAMKKGIAAILHHCSVFFVGEVDDKMVDDKKRHQFCPRTEDTWCKYQKDKLTGESTNKININIPEAVRDVIKPIFLHGDLGLETL